MNKLICAVLCVLAISLTECKTTSKATAGTVAPTPAPAPSPPATAATKNPATDMVMNGLSIFQSSCAGCHEQPKAEGYTMPEWQDIMVKMSRKAHLSDSQTEAVLAYLKVSAKQ